MISSDYHTIVKVKNQLTPVCKLPAGQIADLKDEMSGRAGHLTAEGLKMSGSAGHFTAE
ncbi:MAG: hypothetical protein IKD85_02470 [Firmicutes bacterium]|nr:hypothetical protein [Bacillota bacterium]